MLHLWIDKNNYSHTHINSNYHIQLIIRAFSEKSKNWPMYIVFCMNCKLIVPGVALFPNYRFLALPFNFHQCRCKLTMFYGNYNVDTCTLSKYRLASISGVAVVLIVITIIGKKCQNTHVFSRFPHCVKVFEEMVGN